MNNSKALRVTLEFLPLITFFFFYKFYDIKIATISLVLTTIAATLINYIYNKYINGLIIFTTVIVAVLGFMTVWTDNPIFIKIKPTVVNMLFAAVLMFGIFRKRGYLKYVLGARLFMNEHAWIILSKRFALFFVFMASLNETIWRFCSESTWVWFKVFGTFIILLIFLITQMPFLNRNRLHD